MGKTTPAATARRAKQIRITDRLQYAGNRCCDTRTPGHPCAFCGHQYTDEPITPNQALASNA